MLEKHKGPEDLDTKKIPLDIKLQQFSSAHLW